MVLHWCRLSIKFVTMNWHEAEASQLPVLTEVIVTKYTSSLSSGTVVLTLYQKLTNFCGVVVDGKPNQESLTGSSTKIYFSSFSISVVIAVERQLTFKYWQQLAYSCTGVTVMMVFFFPILEHFCPLWVQIAQMGLILPRWGLILPRIPPPISVLYSALTHLSGICTNTKHPQAPPKTPLFLAWSWKWAKLELQSGQFGPQMGKMLKKWQIFLEVGKNNLFMLLSFLLTGCNSW